MFSGNILFIDAYDSFSNSIIALLKAELAATVETIKIDDVRFVLNDEAFYRYLDGFDAVVAGPGPGHPANAEDVGLIGRLWSLPDEHLLPVLGICLGFQSLCHAFGGEIVRLKESRHGVMAIVTHCGKDIFAEAGKIIATQYHSLHVQLGGKRLVHHDDNPIIWSAFNGSEDLVPLAWDLMNVANGPILMAVKHKQKPFWGVQYHPESICTNDSGRKLVANWWQKVQSWGYRSERGLRLKRPSPAVNSDELCRGPTPQTRPSHDASHRHVVYQAVSLGDSFDVCDLLDALQNGASSMQPLLLESGTRNGRPVNGETGRFSILGIRDGHQLQLRYYTRSHKLFMESNGRVLVELETSVQNAFSYLDGLVEQMRAVDGPADCPFWGGFLGYISYEAGLELIDILPSQDAASRPDMWFVFIDRSVVVDHVKNIAYVQTTRDADSSWLFATVRMVQDMQTTKHGQLFASSGLGNCVGGAIVAEPQMDEYCQKILTCQLNLRAGESYELCLTDQTTVRSPVEPLSLYRHLRLRNPAPFSSYLCLSSPSQPGVTIVSSSPERFLSWTREGRCQFRPIKGTVRKSPDMTRVKAETLLGSTKERAENLMIVDLIRHDLNGVQGVKNVRVPKLMSIEEYETVFQLVSVIEGEFDALMSPTAALVASLPPGSMTGAPKKRSCELLKCIEGEKPRGLYSGVVGYFDVGGGGDFSVVIRTASKWADDDGNWHIGAGGAITVLSQSDSEWEEMLTKRESVLRSFL